MVLLEVRERSRTWTEKSTTKTKMTVTAIMTKAVPMDTSGTAA